MPWRLSKETITKGVFDPKDKKKKIAFALEDLAECLTEKGLSSSVKENRVVGRSGSGIRIRAYFSHISNGNKEGKAKMTYSIDSTNNNKKIINYINQIKMFLSEYEGPFLK